MTIFPSSILRAFGRRSVSVDLERHKALARFSNLASTSYKRHVQSLHELGDRRNPDVLAGVFLSPEERDLCMRLEPSVLAAMRAEPYYYYLVARTKAHDQALLDALIRGLRRVVVVGAGFDTRLYRFGALLAAHGVGVAEFDQPEAIERKRQAARELPFATRVAYLGIDLNHSASWASLWSWMAASPVPLLLLAEGVSPYIEAEAFVDFLSAAVGRMPAGSRLAFDFKRPGVADGFGQSVAVERAFRLAAEDAAAAALLQPMGLSDWRLFTSATLMQEQIPSWSSAVSPLFQEDALLLATR